MTAIRIKGEVIVATNRNQVHYDVLCRYMDANGLTHGGVNLLLEAGEIDFGFMENGEFKSDSERKRDYRRVRDVSCVGGDY